ncbi:MAG: helix-turn-helix domain containing protein [Anaerolineaceae bacterium]|nr:helix-turn-helix domain containing protein [Anaerolineaceae bacterium]
MSTKELSRLEIMQRVKTKKLKQREAASMLRLSERHVKRLYKAFLEKGPEGLISKRRGRLSNNQLDSKFKKKLIDLLHSQYADFGPTLAQEKIMERHKMSISVESVRLIMNAEGLWKPKRKKRVQIHQMRERRACFGDLVQIDGSPHKWFEDRGPACNLLVLLMMPQER